MRENWRPASFLPDNHGVFTMDPDDFHGKQAALDLMALDAYIYGYPLVLLDVTQRIMLTGGLQPNQFLHERSFPTPQYTTIVRPNVDTLYSMAWLDLGREPVVLQVPDTHNRYYLMELLDAWTNVFASIGARTTGTKAGVYAITGPEWNGVLPEGIFRVASPTNTVWVIGRTQTNGPQDYPSVHAIQNRYRLMPLRCWGSPQPPPRDCSGENQHKVNPADLVANMDATAFFQTMAAAMVRNPPWIEDPAMNRKLAALGIAPAATFHFDSLSPAARRAFQAAVAIGPGRIKAETVRNYAQNNIHGWITGRKGMGFYGADYGQRAMIAMAGIGANLPQDAVYALSLLDAAGEQLAGYHHYVLHFSGRQLPPVNAFWSLTLYNDQGYLAANPLNRYAISPHLHRLHYNRDGSLDLFIGNDPPREGAPDNWLPAPRGSFNLVLRMYWPDQQIITGRWNPPPLLRA